MSARRVRDLLDRIGGVADPCDLDLLLFFHRHPRSVLTSQRLAAYVGYELSRVATSLDHLIAAALLSRVHRPNGTTRLYRLTEGGRLGEAIEALLRLASTREGRTEVLAVLSRRLPAIESPSPGGPAPPAARAREDRPSPARSAREFRHA